MLKLKTPIGFIVGSFMLVALGFIFGTSITPGIAETSAYELPEQSQPVVLSEMEQIFANIYNQVSPSVVAISTDVVADGGFFPEGSGSGFVIDTLGHIVTNFHVVSTADRIVVNMYDGTIVEASLIGADVDSDLAVIKVNLPADRLIPVPLGSSDNLAIGQTVLAIGNPFNRTWTLTSGIVSALNRRIDGLDRFAIGGVIQTDAAINPGNSGGPLLNLQGEVIGVNSQIEIRNGVRLNAGVGFAIPSNLVRRVATALIERGEVNYSYLGLNSETITLDMIEAYSLPNNIRGVAVRQVLPGGPSRNAGLQTISESSVDIITAIDGHAITSFDELIGYLAINTVPGQTVSLDIYRNGQTLQIPVTLGARP